MQSHHPRATQLPERPLDRQDPQTWFPIPTSRAQRRFIPSPEGSLDQPARTPAAGPLWACSSTMQYLQGLSDPISFLFLFDVVTGLPGASLLPSTPRSPTVAPSCSFTASSNGLPGSHFSSPARSSAVCTPAPGQRTLLVSPRYFRLHRPGMACSCTHPRLGGSRGRRPTDHHTWTARVNNSLTSLVTTSALPRRRVTCARAVGYLFVRVSGSFRA